MEEHVARQQKTLARAVQPDSIVNPGGIVERSRTLFAPVPGVVVVGTELPQTFRSAARFAPPG